MGETSADARPTPGVRTLNVRLPADLHAEPKATAEKQGVSLNQLVVALLAVSIGWKPGKSK
jgi:predicted HicB family RNase H-like nuclease